MSFNYCRIIEFTAKVFRILFKYVIEYIYTNKDVYALICMGLSR